MRYSEPSNLRAAVAIAFYLIAGAAAAAVKLGRPQVADTSPLLLLFYGVAPNLFPAALLPFLVFIRKHRVCLRDYLAFTFTIFLALSAYEVSQLWMSKRTFDWNDITASAVGAIVAVPLGWLVFFLFLGTTSHPSASRQCT
jgi:hypothetical protein